MTGLASAVAAGIFPLASIAAFLNICTLAYLIMLAYGLIRLRKEKGMPKAGEFKTPLVTPVTHFINHHLFILYVTV